MTTPRSSVYDEKPPDFSSIQRTLSALSVEERAIEMPLEGDLSDVSTLAFGREAHDSHQFDVKPPQPQSENSSGWSTPAADSPTSRPVAIAKLVRRDSQVMQIGTEKTTKWSKYPKKGYKTTTKFFYEEIDSSWTAALIIVCFFVSGIVESVSYQTFSVFTSLQTGNTIFLALRLSDQPANRHHFAYIKSLTSIVAYCIGGLIFNMLHRAPTDMSDPKVRLHRWTLFTSFLIQSVSLVLAAALAQSGYISTRPSRSGTFSSGSARNPEGMDNYLDLMPIALLAFEAAGQVCLSRVLFVNELPTIVISTLYHDFIADALSWRQLWKNRKSTWDFVEGQKRQIRRFLSIIALFSGAAIGGFVYASPGGIAAALWIAAGSKVIVSLAWCLWKRKIITETVVTRGPPTPAAK